MPQGEPQDIEILGRISRPQTIAVGRGIRDIERLKRVYGPGRWRKRKGFASVKLPDQSICKAEVHGYETSGIGRKEFKIKRIITD